MNAPDDDQVPMLARAASEPRAALRWLTYLRWASVGGQLATIAIASAFTGITLDLAALLLLVGLAAVSNVGLMLHLRHGSRGASLIAAVLVLDVVLLTGLLLAAGGSANPFSIFYLVHVVLAGLLLGARGAWTMAGLTSAAFGLLFFLPSVPIDEHAMHHGASSLHLQGMWVAYALASAFVATFVSGLTHALARRGEELARLADRAERSERLAALATFSASAAHELGSPLTTIAVTARELELSLARPMEGRDVTPLVEDARLIRGEVERCRAMLHDLTRRGGLLQGEQVEVVGASTLWSDVRARLASRPGLVLVMGPGAPDVTADVMIVAPRVALVQALCNLVENAHEAGISTGGSGASGAQADVPVTIGTDVRGDGAERVRLWVRDVGRGFAPEVLAQLGEAFVTTRPGQGLGLGLHLAAALAKALGGRLDVVSGASGSEVALELPRDPVAMSGRQEARA